LKKLYFVIAAAIFFSFPVLAQENILLKGKINTQYLEGSVHIINMTQKTGTVNSSSGAFEIMVRENDTLLFSSIQIHKHTVPITSEIISNGFIEVELIEDVNELPEVNISNTTLTGNINTDLASIKTVKDLPVNISYEAIKNLRFPADHNDPQAAPVNHALIENQLIRGAGSVNILGGLDLLADLIGIKKKPQPKTYSGPPERTSVQLRKRFDDDFFTSSLGIKEKDIGDFLFYLDDQNISAQLMGNSKGLALIELLIDHSDKYKQQKEGY